MMHSNILPKHCCARRADSAGSLNTVCSRCPMLRLRHRVHLRARFELGHDGAAGDAKRIEEVKEEFLISLGRLANWIPP
jgi:hypothetical protein